MDYDFTYQIYFPDDESPSSYLKRVTSGLLLAMDNFQAKYNHERIKNVYVGSWLLKQTIDQMGMKCYYSLPKPEEIVIESETKLGLITLNKVFPILLKKRAGMRE